MTFLEIICSNFAKAGLRYAVVGGHAVALHGAIRGTVDIDFVIKWNKKQLIVAEHELNNMGLISRLPINAIDVFEFREEYITNRNLIAWNFYDPEDLSKQVDIIINYDLSGKKTQQITLGKTKIRILAMDDLIAMKLESGRDQDVSDVKALSYLRDNKL